MIWSKKGQYANALSDLDQAIALEEQVKSYYARAQVYASQGKVDRAVADFRRATELAPRNPFDLTAQADAKKRIEQLDKQVPCGDRSAAQGGGSTTGQGGGNATCL
jgi:tetratricopeptide (TPR) repeat protein